MRIYIDTSAILALLNESDQEHAVSEQRLLHLLSIQSPMVISNYAVVEACAVLQRRVGMRGVRTFHDDLLPLLIVVWVTERQHEAAMSSLIRSDRRKLSLVDCVSFEVMRDQGLRTAFAFDRHFTDEGFDCDIPSVRSH